MIIVRSFRIECQRLVLEGMQKILHIALQIEKNPPSGVPHPWAVCEGGDGRAHTNALGLDRGRSRCFENTAGFEQAHIVCAAIEVVRQHVEHARHQRTAHHRRLFALRIGQFDHRHGGKCFRVLMRDEGQRNRFVVTESQQRRCAACCLSPRPAVSTTAPAYAGSVLANLS